MRLGQVFPRISNLAAPGSEPWGQPKHAPWEEEVYSQGAFGCAEIVCLETRLGTRGGCDSPLRPSGGNNQVGQREQLRLRKQNATQSAKT